MSSTSDPKTGGASIKPSARPSIHNHATYPFDVMEGMGQYGIKNKNVVRDTPSRQHAGNGSNDHGTDEVDNVFSKPSQNISSSSFTQINRYRRKSSDEVMEQIETDSNTLSKSLPATFSLHSHCSDDSDSMAELPIGQNSQYSDSSRHSDTFGMSGSTSSPVDRAPLYSTRNFNGPGLPRSKNILRTEENESSSKYIFPLFIVAILIAAVSTLNTKNVMQDVYDESRFYNDVDMLGSIYGIHRNAVLQMQSGVATIFERQDTGSFVFVYDSNAHNFKSSVFNMFINDVANIASKYLRNESTPIYYTLVEGSTLNMFDSSELINTFRGDLDKTGVMLVKNVDTIPSALAMAFHFYCDEYNPLVKKSAIFFTLDIAKCKNVMEKKATHAVIEKCLSQKWNGVPADSIGPLLTRVVNVVIDLTGPLSLV